MSAPLLAALLACAAPARAASADAGAWDARLAGYSGEVTVFPAGGGESLLAEADMPLEKGDRVTTGPGASAEISLDGSGLISLRENSDLTLKRDDREDASFSLDLGNLLAKIEKLGTRRLKIATPTMVAAVRGTEFGVEVVDENNCSAAVFDEGSVEVRAENGTTATLTSNQETFVLRGQPVIPPFALRRFAARRAIMRAHAARLAAVRARWRPVAAGARLELRRRALERMRQRHGKRLERFQQRRQRQQQRRRHG